MKVWRLTRRRFAQDGQTAYNGFGASRLGQRWNSRGIFLAYATTSSSLALLEYLAHIDWSIAPTDLAYFTATIPDDSLTILAVSDLPLNWANQPHGTSTQAIGDRFVESARSLALSVPSVMVPDGQNILINPKHPRFSEVHFDMPIPCLIDARLQPPN